MAPDPVDLPPTIFYQAVAAIFAVLLLSGVVTEMRALGDADDEDRSLGRGEIARLALFTTMCLLLLAGELVTLDVLVDPPVSEWQHWIISVALLVGLVAVPAMAFLQAWERLPARARRPVLVGGAAALGIAVAAVVLLARSAGEFGIGRWDVPELYEARVYGTCAAGGCGLNMHTEPSREAPRIGEPLPDGERVYVVCQRAGDPLTAANGQSSRVWNRLTEGGWVSDLYLMTPARGGFSSQIERCE